MLHEYRITLHNDNNNNNIFIIIIIIIIVKSDLKTVQKVLLALVFSGVMIVFNY